MGKAAVSIGARISRLELAERRAASLPRGAKLASRAMSELCGVSWPVLRGWCDEFPELEAKGAVTRGGNGIEWEFAPRKFVSMLLRTMRKIRDGQARKSRAITKSIGVNLPEAEEAPSYAETKSLVELTMTVTAAKERQGEYAPAAEVKDFIVGYNQAVLDGILGVRTKVDPSGTLTPALRKAVDDELRALAVRVNAIATRFVEGRLGAGL